MSFKKFAQDPDEMQGMSIPVDNREEMESNTVVPDTIPEISNEETIEDEIIINDTQDINQDIANTDDVLMDDEELTNLPDPFAAGQISQSIQIGDRPPQTETLNFTLSELPGADVQIEEEEDVQDAVVIEEKQPEKPKGPWDWDIKGFIQWVMDRMKMIPKHDGKSIPGILRAISFLKAIEREIRRAMSSDIDGELEIADIDKIRGEITDGIKRLDKRMKELEEKESGKKSVKKNASIKKEAFGTFVITVPIYISSIARICLNSMVSAGKDIEEVFAALCKKYKLDDKEQLSLIQVLADMGYPMRRPRGYNMDEEIDVMSTDNFDWAALYYA